MAILELPSFVEAYIDRAEWGADPLEPKALALPVEQFVGWVLHHTVFALADYDRDGFLKGDQDDIRRYMRVLQKARPDLGSEVPYSWVIFAGTTDDTCVIAEGRGRGRRGAHTAGLNSSRYAWAIAGNTDADQPITPGMVAGMRWLAGLELEDPVGAARAIGHQQAPPYIQDGKNLNATGCPGKQGLSVLSQLQPPYQISTPAPAPAPAGSRRDTSMFTVKNAEGLAITFRVSPEGRLEDTWRNPDGKRVPWQEVTPGVFENLGQPLTAGTAIWLPVVASAGQFGDPLLTVVQATVGGPWTAYGTDQLNDYLASLP